MNHGLAKNLDDKCNELLESCNSGELKNASNYLSMSQFQKINLKTKNLIFMRLKMLTAKLVD